VGKKKRKKNVRIFLYRLQAFGEMYEGRTVRENGVSRGGGGRGVSKLREGFVCAKKGTARRGKGKKLFFVGLRNGCASNENQ